MKQSYILLLGGVVALSLVVATIGQMTPVVIWAVADADAEWALNTDARVPDGILARHGPADWLYGGPYAFVGLHAGTLLCDLSDFNLGLADPDEPAREIGNPVTFETVAASGGLRQRAIMVGDSGTDIKTARAANVPVIAVDYGYTEVPAAELRPDRVISHFDELMAACDALMAG